MLKKGIYGGLFLALSLCITSSALAGSQITNGLSWLNSSQTSTGNWPGVETTEYHSTAVAVDAIFALAPTSSSYAAGLQWMTGQIVSPTDYLSRRIIALKRAGMDASAEVEGLILYRNSDGGWGSESGYLNDIIDTALALRALKAANYPDLSIINGGTAYLTSAQNVDSGWGSYSGDDSNVYMTALVASTLQLFPQTTTLATALSKATIYLVAHQNTDGGFGSSPSTVYETALAYEALANVITDATVLGKAVNYLTTTQSSDGSWGQDPYSTALALKALHYSENKPAPPPTPTTGTLTGKVISAGNGSPLSGVAVSLSGNPAFTTLTDSTGVFKLAEVTQGTQQIVLTLHGYITVSTTTTITAGTIVNLGNLSLSAASSTGAIQGIVTDSTTRLPLAGVVITVTGGGTIWTAPTSADGTFMIADITPGVVTISAALAGYPSVIVNGTVTAGGVLLFSPALSTSPPTTTTGIMRGIIIDAVTGLPIPGATVTLTSTRLSYTTTTTMNGEYSITGIEPSDYGIRFSAPGYYTRVGNEIVNISAGSVTDWASKLYPAPVSSTIRGKLTDSASGSPVADAEVSITGTKFSAKTDASGTYVISGINLLEFEIKAASVSYDSKTYTIKSPYHDDLTVDFTLDPSRWGHLGIMSVSTDRGSYQAYSDVAITAEVLNTDVLPMNALVSVSITNPQGDVIDILQGSALDTNGVAQSNISFPPGIVKTINIAWGTGYDPPGVYSILVEVKEDTPAAGLVVVAQRTQSITIDPTQAVSSLVLTPLPRFTNLGANEQIGLQTSLVNHSNVPTEITFSYTWKSPSGLLLRSGSGTIPIQPAEISKSVLVDIFPFTFTESGDHPLQVQIIAGPTPVDLVARSVSVAPGIRIEASQSLTPTSVIPEGNQRIRVNIKLKGVEQK